MTDPALRVLFLNAYLLRVFEAEIGRRRLRIASKPRVSERAHELGQALCGQYDVIVLAEVFDERELRSILAAWPHEQPPSVHVGPVSNHPGVLHTSGLATIVARSRPGRVAARGFVTRGSRFHDADAWAEKGALLCEVPLGAAKGGPMLEITSTHLLAGGGLLPRPPVPGYQRADTCDDRARRAQVAELRRFVDDHHVEGNLQLVVGDFNIAAADPAGRPTDAYRELVDGLDQLDDLWVRRDGPGRGPGPTCDIDEARPEFEADPGDARFYREDVGAPAASARIDYAFGSPGLAVRSLRRRRLPRSDQAPGLAEIDLLSDHVGLHLEVGRPSPDMDAQDHR